MTDATTTQEVPTDATDATDATVPEIELLGQSGGGCCGGSACGS
ncbi:hypothetical protein [Cryobacterium sp. TMT1-2-1]|nr:hypothetical protein [Cryobacterium sp. TMT1-2-1]